MIGWNRRVGDRGNRERCNRYCRGGHNGQGILADENLSGHCKQVTTVIE